MNRQGYGAEELVMEGCPTKEDKEERLERFMRRAPSQCVGCGARFYKTEAPYSGHAHGCSLVAWWRKWDEIREAHSVP